MSAWSAIAASASTAPGTTFWRCISPSKKPSSSGQTRSASTGRPSRSAQRVAKAGSGEIEAEIVRFRHPVGEMRDHVEQDLVAIGDEQGPAAHASSLRRASTSVRRRHVQRLGGGERGPARAPRGRRGPRRAARARRAAREALAGSRPVRASSRCARASSPSVQPRAERARASGSVGFVSSRRIFYRCAGGTKNPRCRGQRTQSEAVLRPAARARLLKPSRFATAARRWTAPAPSRPTSSSWTSRCRMSAASS